MDTQLIEVGQRIRSHLPAEMTQRGLAEAVGMKPDHNQSFPAAVKNAVDILTRPGGTSVLGGMPVTIAGTSPGRFGTISSQSQLRQFLPMLGVRFMGSPNLAVGGAGDVFAEDGTADAQTTERARKFIAAFVDFVRAG